MQSRKRAPWGAFFVCMTQARGLLLVRPGIERRRYVALRQQSRRCPDKSL